MASYDIEFDEVNNVVEIIYEGVNAVLIQQINVRLTTLEAEFAAHVGEAGGAIVELEDDINSLQTLLGVVNSNLVAEISTREDVDFTMNESFSTQLLAQQTEYSDLITNEAETRAQAILDEATARGAAIASSEAIIMTDVAILATTVDGIATELGAAQASIIEVSDALVTETAARAAQYSAIQADFGDTNAAVLEESVARADADTAFASMITVIEAEVDTKITTFRQTSAPTATAIGDIWYDSDAGDAMYRWNGSTWGSVDNAQIATNTAAITTESTARVSGDSANASSITALTAVVSSKNVTFSQTTAPVSGMVSGDVWFDTDDGNKAYRYNGSSWVLTDDARIATNSAAVITEASARVAADGTIEAKYGVKVDVNGHVAGFGLIATANNASPTSAFVVTASSFQVFDGTSTLPVFSISGGVVRMTNVIIGNAVIENLAVGTSKIANEAVNVIRPISVGSNYPTTTSLTVGGGYQQIAITPALGGGDWDGYSRVVTVSIDATVSGSTSSFIVARIRRGNGTFFTLWEGMSDSGNASKSYAQIKGSFTVVDTTGAGPLGLISANSLYYTLELSCSGGSSASYQICTIVVTAVKK